MIDKEDMKDKLINSRNNTMPQIAEVFFDNQDTHLTCMQVEEITGIIYDTVKKAVATLQRAHGFEFDKERFGSRMGYKLIGLNGDTAKYKIRKKRKPREKPPLVLPKLHPLIEKVFR